MTGRQIENNRTHPSGIYTLRTTPYASRFTPHISLFLILLIFTALTLYHSIILPLGEADDETDHYQYLRFVARTGHPPFTDSERDEAGFKGGLAPLYYWLTTWPVALVGEETLPDVRRVDARPERHIPTDGLGINHVLHTLDEQWPWRGQTLAWHLVRFLSLPMAWVTIVATYLLARRLYPEPKIIAIGAATFVAFLPRFVSSSAVINDDNLVFALTSLLLLVQVIILQDTFPSPRLFAVFGALFGLALITKYFSLILIPEIVFTLVVSQAAGRRLPKDRIPESAKPPPGTEDRHLPSNLTSNTQYVIRYTNFALRTTYYVSRSPLLAFLLALALTAGPWFIFIMLRFNRISDLGLVPGLAASLGEPQITEGLVGLISGSSIRPVAATYPWFEWLGFLYRSFWFEFGWMRIFAPTWIYSLFTVFLILAITGHVLRISSLVKRPTPYALRPTSYASPIHYLLTLHLALFLVVVLARYVLSATIDTGQGRHLYPALAVIALVVSLGLVQLGFRILDLLFRMFPSIATNILPIVIRRLPAPLQPLLLTSYSLLPTLFFLLPAAYCLLSPSLILSHYHILPVTITPPADLPITSRQNLTFASGLSLSGFDAPTSVSAGDVLPVTLYWRAEQEAQRDFLISLCLQDEDNRPVACWRGHFADGRYPTRAWEIGDTLADKIFIPIPTCHGTFDQPYRLHLKVWPLALDSPEPALDGPPVLQQTFADPSIAIQPANSLIADRPRTFEVWHANQRLTGSTAVSLGETLTWLDYATSGQNQLPGFISHTSNAASLWSSVPDFNTPLFLPCHESSNPLAQVSTFIAGPTLAPGPYSPTPSPTSLDLRVSLNSRQRIFAPINSTLVFTPYLAPLTIEFPDQAPINLNLESSNLPTFQPSDYPPLQPSNPILPITIRWQGRSWMPDPLIVSLKLLDKDFSVGGERLATLGDRYPNVLWAPTEVVEETYPLRLRPDTPPGLYRLEVSLLRQDKNLPEGYEYLPLTGGETSLGHNLYPTTFRLLDPAGNGLPSHPLSAQLGEAIRLTGYDLIPISNLQSPISLTLYWQSTAKIPTDYTVFTQLLGPDGQVWAQWDNPPQAGRYPTTVWTTQDSVVDRYSLTLREGAPSGQYRLLVGMYDPMTGQRLPAAINGQPQPDNAIEITQLTLRH